MSSKTLCIIIPVYGQLSYTKKVLASIEKHVITTYDSVLTMVVDNASTDNTRQWLILEWLHKPLPLNPFLEIDTTGPKHVF
jgi:GT2 family glycosyltransferase